MVKPLAELRIFYIAIVVCLVFSIYAAYQANHRAYQTCMRIEVIKANSERNTLRAIKTIPLSAYYQQNKEELRGALNNLYQQRQ